MAVALARVLVFEPDSTLREITAEVLTQAGYFVTQLADFNDSLILAVEVHSDLILIGLHPLRPHDIQVLHDLNTHPKLGRVPVIAFSGLADVLVETSTFPNVRERLSYPLNVADLENAVARVLAKAGDTARQS